MDAQKYRKELREGSKGGNWLCKEYKGVKWAEGELKRIEGITNQEEQNKEAKKIWEICDKVYSLVYNVPEGVDPTEHYGFNHFKKVYERLKYLKNKSSQNQNSSNSSDYSLSNEIKGLISKNYHNFSADDLQRLAQKLLELSREYSESLNSNLKPYCDSLIETLQKLTDNAYETWNSPDKLQEWLNWCLEKEKVIGKINLNLLKGATSLLYPNVGYLFWSGYEGGKMTIRKRISELENGNSQSNENNQVEYISCQQCYKEIKSGKSYWYHKTKNDGYKFCSTKCYDNYYGEYCDKCANKFLTTYPYENNNYCSICYEKVIQEEREEEEKSIRYCKYCSTKLVKEGNLKYSLEICNRDDCFLKLDKELYPDKYSQLNDNNINNDNNHHIRERERERERERATSIQHEPITVWNHSIRI